MKTEVIQEMVNRNSAGTISFVEVLEILKKEKVESYHVDFLRNEARYYGEHGDSIVIQTDHSPVTIPEKFSIEQFKEVLKKAQNKDIPYKAFCMGSQEAGCAYYMVYITGKQVHYLGRKGDTYTESIKLLTT